MVQSGVLAALQTSRLLIDHDPAPIELALDRDRAHAVIAPQPVDFISYPYEWSFGELKDAALLTLQAQALVTERGFTLRDASPYNVQFHKGRPILIDTLSFERAASGAPWLAYRQFCEQFLAPLALMANRDVRCGLMLRDFIDGIPLDLAATLLPGRTRLNLGLLSHLHLHARAQRGYANRAAGARSAAKRTMSPLQHRALVDSLRRTVEHLRWKPTGTEWADYVSQTSYGDEATQAKDDLVRAAIAASVGAVVWDLGSNTGRFSQIAASLGRRVVAWDVDPAATERHYRAIRQGEIETILPLILDLANPSPGIGWAGVERKSLAQRSDADVVLALALVHHLAISRNIPLAMLAGFLADLAPALVIEFVPKDDPMVQRLLATREDVFPDYTIVGFRTAFGRHFEIDDERPIPGMTRTLFRMTRLQPRKRLMAVAPGR